MKRLSSFIILLSFLVCVTACRTTRNVSSASQSDFVGVSHETDCQTDSQTLTLQVQRILSLSVDSLFIMLSPSGLAFEVAETAQTEASRSRPSSSNVRVYGIHLTDSAGLQSDGQAVSNRNASAADSTKNTSAITQNTSSQKADASFGTTLKWILWLLAIGAVVFLIWKVRKALPI